MEGSRLRSLVNGKSYGIGKLELVSLQTLRDRARSGNALSGQLNVAVIRGDVGKLHQAPENAGAMLCVTEINMFKSVLLYSCLSLDFYELA